MGVRSCNCVQSGVRGGDGGGALVCRAKRLLSSPSCYETTQQRRSAARRSARSAAARCSASQPTPTRLINREPSAVSSRREGETGEARAAKPVRRANSSTATPPTPSRVGHGLNPLIASVHRYLTLSAKGRPNSGFRFGEWCRGHRGRSEFWETAQRRRGLAHRASTRTTRGGTAS